MFFQNDIFGNSVPREGIQLPFLFFDFYYCVSRHPAAAAV